MGIVFEGENPRANLSDLGKSREVAAKEKKL